MKATPKRKSPKKSPPVSRSKVVPPSPNKPRKRSRQRQPKSKQPATPKPDELQPPSPNELQPILPEAENLQASFENDLAKSLANTCPLWLRTKPIACDKWHELYGALLARRQLEVVDWDLLSLYCDCWQEIFDADALITKEGEFQKTEKGYSYAHPAVLKRNTAIDRMKKIAIDLGIGFRARKGTRGQGGGSESSELDDF